MKQSTALRAFTSALKKVQKKVDILSARVEKGYFPHDDDFRALLDAIETMRLDAESNMDEIEDAGEKLKIWRANKSFKYAV